jgi:hypothetical protein
VYLPSVEVSKYTLEDIDLLKNEVYQMMEEGLRRYRQYPLA